MTTHTNLADAMSKCCSAPIYRDRIDGSLYCSVCDAAAAPKCTCLNCGEPITGDVAEFESYPFRTFCMDCMDELGAARAFLLARTAPESAWSDVTGLADDGDRWPDERNFIERASHGTIGSL